MVNNEENISYRLAEEEQERTEELEQEELDTAEDDESDDEDGPESREVKITITAMAYSSYNLNDLISRLKNTLETEMISEFDEISDVQIDQV